MFHLCYICVLIIMTIFIHRITNNKIDSFEIKGYPIGIPQISHILPNIQKVWIRFVLKFPLIVHWLLILDVESWTRFMEIEWCLQFILEIDSNLIWWKRKQFYLSTYIHNMLAIESTTTLIFVDTRKLPTIRKKCIIQKNEVLLITLFDRLQQPMSMLF